MKSFFVDYKSNKSELCEIGRKYDTDKSSQRDNSSDSRHCHPYTLFYDSLFKGRREENLNIAEIGILYGASLLMWQEYFKSANIYGFEYNETLINNFKETYNNDRITLSTVNVQIPETIVYSFFNTNVLYDIIIDDSTHQFEDQIKVIESTYRFLKPGGVMIIEDIFKDTNENTYLYRLAPILHNFQDYYFITLDHENRISTHWNNDKLLILVKNGANPLFNNKHKLTIITPSYRIDNLRRIKESINFDYVSEWIIVYDQTKITENPYLFANDDKIKEYLHTSHGISGNPQRNFALSMVSDKNSYIYFLDDDNIIHPDFVDLMNLLDDNKIYTFNQTIKVWNGNSPFGYDNVLRLKGNNINVQHIDTAMFLIHYSLCKNTPWILEKYDADGFFIKECYEKHKEKHIFIDNVFCYYNFLA